MQRASKRAPQWLRDLGVFILVMGGAVGICMLLSACYDDNNPFATSVFILAVVLISRFTNGYLPGVLAALERRGLLERSALVSNCGLPGEQVYADLSVFPREQDAGYFATIIVKED